MYSKYKLTTFIGKSVPFHLRRMQGFKALLKFPAELYGAHLSPMEWNGRPGQRPDKRDDFLYRGTSDWDAIQGAFLRSTRLEMHLSGFEPQDAQIAVDLVFCKSRKRLEHVTFSFNPAENEVGSGHWHKCES